MARKRRHVSFIEAAIPPKRGIARHYEHDDHTSYVEYAKDGEIKEIHTPQDALRRVHEVMHARHSRPPTIAYPGIRKPVADIIEDCRLHLTKWPWQYGDTPKAIVGDADLLFKMEDKAFKEAAKANIQTIGGMTDAYKSFASKLRRNATYAGMNLSKGRVKYDRHDQTVLANRINSLIKAGRAQEAAWLMERAFFADEENPSPPPPEANPSDDGEPFECEDGDEDANGDDGMPALATMETIELPLTEPTDHHDKGYRLATSGSRIYRPALRRPILPHRLFIKSAPVAPGGAILFDASGSMNVDLDVLLDCCRRAPSAAVAAYRGDDSCQGWLYIFARDGMRAANLGDFDHRSEGNSVDGPAMDWLMNQDGPRMFVTDREFCGSADSIAQKVRLSVLEELGEIEVFTSYDEFQTRFAPVADAA